MSQDQVFKNKMDKVHPFEFNQGVADVFDDMVKRSVPFYEEIHRLTLDIIERRYSGKGFIFDLGCSTGTTFELISKQFPDREFKFIGVDNSKAMLNKANEKLSPLGLKNLELRNEGMQETNFNNAEIVILNYTLQFLPVEKRLNLLEKIYNSLPTGGVLILSEKIKSPRSEVQELITDLYYDFKRRNGYSELEISQKREALENVLIPLTPKEQVKMLKEAGFEKTEMLFRWYNFASYIGIK